MSTRSQESFGRRYLKHWRSLNRWSQSGFVLAVALGIVIVAQLCYPGDRALLRARVAGESVGFYHQSAIDAIAEDKEASTKIRFISGNHTSQAYSIHSLHGEIEKASVFDQIKYPLGWRFVPFSVLFLSKDIVDVGVKFDEAKLDEGASKKVASAISTKSHPVVVYIENAKVKTKPANTGSKVKPEAVKKALQRQSIALGSTSKIKVDYTRDRPPVAVTNLTEVKDKLEALLSKPLTVIAGDESVSVSPKIFGEWVNVVVNDTKELEVLLDDKKVVQYTNNTFGKKLSKIPGKTKVRLLDGVEQGRSAAKAGRAIDGGATYESFSRAMLGSNQSKATVVTKEIPPIEVYVRNYTHTQRGLNAYAQYLNDEEQTSVVVKQLQGSMAASGGGSNQHIAASTYKLYVAQYALNQIKSKKLSFNDSIINQTVQECLQKMIVESDNPCAEAFIKKFKPSKINEFLYKNDYSKATTFTDPETAKTSAADLARVLEDIRTARYITSQGRDMLLGFMKQQQYRQGIPAGSSGLVANKVGFLNNILNDAGIVYHPKSDYIMVILTKNKSWSNIAQITKKIETIMFGS